MLAESVDRFRELTAIAGPAYRTATGMETTQRQIPFRGGMNQFPNWQQCLPMYEKELTTFRKRIAQLSSGAKIEENKPVEASAAGCIHAQAGAGEAFTVEKGANLFMGAGAAISDLAPELAGMKGIRIAPSEGGTLHFDLAQPRRSWSDLRERIEEELGARSRNRAVEPDAAQCGRRGEIPAMAVWAKPLAGGRRTNSIWAKDNT